MRIIRTQNRSVIGTADVDRITKEMVNIYHGIQYYDAKGVLLETPVPGYLSWEQGTAEYGHIPVRAYIYINYENSWDAAGFIITNFKKNLQRGFHTNNKWGFRETVFLEQRDGSNQFTLEEYLLETGPLIVNAVMVSPMAIVNSSHPLNIKHRENQFTWIVTDNHRMFQYGLPGKYTKIPNMIASTVTIVVDVMHSLMDLEDGSHTLGFPVLKKNVKVLKQHILLSKYVGIDAHVYKLLGGAVDSRRFDGFHQITIRLATDSYEPKEFHKLIKSLTELQTRESSETKWENDKCGLCYVPVFGDYYVVRHAEQPAVVCKFCAHYDSKIAAEINSDVYKVYRKTHTHTTTSMLQIVDVTPVERVFLKSLLTAVQTGDIEMLDHSSPPDNHRLPYSKTLEANPRNVLLCCNAKCLGIPWSGVGSGELQHNYLEQLHLIKDGTTLFEFEFFRSY